jgi:hypothetical protein
VTTTLIDTTGQPLTIRRGSSPTHTFNILEAGTTNPKNLIGATEVTFVIAAGRRATKRDLMLTLGNGTSHNGAGGVVSVAMTAAQTEGLPDGDRYCELWVTDLEGRRDVVGEGLCKVLNTLVTVP